MLDGGLSKRLEQRASRLKGRARAKQQWLEKVLTTPPRSASATRTRRRWIAYALDRIKRMQANVARRAGVLDAYSEHLHVLEMTLMAASEEHVGGKPTSDTQAESKS
jgi:hypothetical protein